MSYVLVTAIPIFSATVGGLEKASSLYVSENVDNNERLHIWKVFVNLTMFNRRVSK